MNSRRTKPLPPTGDFVQVGRDEHAIGPLQIRALVSADD